MCSAYLYFYVSECPPIQRWKHLPFQPITHNTVLFTNKDLAIHNITIVFNTIVRFIQCFSIFDADLRIFSFTIEQMGISIGQKCLIQPKSNNTISRHFDICCFAEKWFRKFNSFNLTNFLETDKFFLHLWNTTLHQSPSPIIGRNRGINPSRHTKCYESSVLPLVFRYLFSNPWKWFYSLIYQFTGSERIITD